MVLLIAVCVVIIAYAALFGWVCYAETHQETAPATDAMIVLGAQVKADGTPSVQLQYRLETALEAYMAQPQMIVCCGGQAGKEPAPEGKVMVEWLRAHGVPDSDLLAETESADTKQNIANAIRLLGYTPVKILIVTSDYHVARAVQVARDQGLQAWGKAAPTLPEYWLKNRSREALGWGKYLLNKALDRVRGK